MADRPAAVKRRKIKEPPEVAELREAFETWAAEHGFIWFDNDVRLADAIAKVLNIDLVWGDDVRKGASRVGGEKYRAALERVAARLADAERENARLTDPNVARDQMPALFQAMRERAERAEQERDEYRKALQDELDNWNPEARPTITARAEAAEARNRELTAEIESVRQWFRQKAWEGNPDPMDHGGQPYSPNECALGYGTYRDPRFLPAVLAADPETRPA